MKWWILATLALSGVAHAEEGYLLKVHFIYKQQSRFVEMKSESIIADDVEDYVSVGTPVKGVSLLAKLTPAENDQMLVEYMIVDTKMEKGLQKFRIATADGVESTVRQEVGKDETIIRFLEEPVFQRG